MKRSWCVVMALVTVACSSGGGGGSDAAVEAAADGSSPMDAGGDSPSSPADAAPEAGPGMGMVSAVVDGTPYTTSSALMTDFSDNAISAGFTGVLDPHNLSFSWTGAGPLTVDQSGAMQMSWSEKQGNVWSCNKNVMGSSCTVTVTAYAKTTGAPVQGTFSGTFARTAGSVGPATRVVTNGTFDMRHP